MPNRFLKRTGEFIGPSVAVEWNRASHVNRQFAGTEPAGLFALKLAQALQGDGQHRDARLRRQQANSGTEGIKSAILGATAFGEDEHGIATIESFAGVGEAAPETT